MRVIVTRPIEDCARTADALRAAGHEAQITPLFAIKPLEHPEPPEADVCLATSANALRHAALSAAQKHRPFFAVGDATAAEARRLGFSDVHSSHGDSRDLAALLTHAVKPGASVAYLTGIPRRDESLLALRDRFSLRIIETYETAVFATIPEDLKRILSSEGADAVLHFSPRAASIFSHLCDAAGFQTNIDRLLHIFISKAAELPRFPRRRVACKPDMQSMIAALRHT